MEDSLGYVWFAGYYDGLHRFSRKDGTWKNYRHDSTDSCSIAHDKVISLHIDDSRRLWICTEGGGVCRYDYGTDRFRKLNLRRPDSTMVTLSVIYGILNDSEGRIWLSSNNGIWCCGTDGEVFRHLAGEDGLQSNQYNFGASFKSSTGLLYFGGINGFNVINPENLKKNPVKPGVTARAVISGEKDAGQSGRSVIPRNANSFSVNFECLSYTAPDRNLFAYRIDRQQEWITTGEPSVTFINFPYGTHHIHVRARNGEGLWSDEIVLGITNLPPLSKSRTARIIYLLAAATLLFLALSFAVRRMKEQERVRAKEAEIKREQEEYNERIKSYSAFSTRLTAEKTYAIELLDGGILAGGVLQGEEFEAATYQQKLVAQLALSKDTYSLNQGWCQKWVATTYQKALGGSYSSSCCATSAADKWIVSKSDKIPIGATVYGAHSWGGVGCTSCGKDAGHVGIYVGNGKIANLAAGYALTDFQGWMITYGYRGWGWNGGVPLN